MVSRFSYPHLTKIHARRRHDFAFLVEAILIVAIMFLSPVLTVFLLFWVYGLQTPAKSLLAWTIRRIKKLPPSEATHTLS